MQPNSPIPDLTATTRDGIEWNPCDENWNFLSPSHRQYLTFSNLKPFATQYLIDNAKKVLMHYLANYSLGYAGCLFHMLSKLLKFIGRNERVTTISSTMILTYRSTLNERNECHLIALRIMFETWINLGIPGIDPQALGVLKEMKLKCNPKGEAVLTLDPTRGPFTDIEFQAIINALNYQFAKGTIQTENYILVWLFLALGSRPVQLAALKTGDFCLVKTTSGTVNYILNVPRAKQRAESPRSQFKSRKLLIDIGVIIERYLIANEKRWSHLGISTNALPFFVNPINIDAMPILRYHCTSANLINRLESIFKLLSVKSERTGHNIIGISRRFRYTRGTRAATENASEYVIAEILDHSDIQNIYIYIQAVPTIIERIDRAMAIHLAPIAQAFTGLLIKDESEAQRGEYPPRIVRSTNRFDKVGNCGRYAFCEALTPIVCYTCRNFQPWLDAPHEELLMSLIQERERILAETGDMTIAAINDRTILACAEVVRQCDVRKGKSQEA